MERKNVQKNPAVASYCDRFEKISMDLCLAQLSMLSAEKEIIKFHCGHEWVVNII